jgi:hypothetical protein
MYYNNSIVVHSAALKHGVHAEDAIAATTGYLVSVTIDESSPSRDLRLGFDTRGRLLETVVLIFDDGRQLIIHAMKARLAYLDLLPREWLP